VLECDTDDGRECAGNYPTQCLWNDTRGSTEGSLREGSEESQVHTNRRRSGSLVHGELVEVEWRIETKPTPT
jgi:hypothetical protein